MAAITEQLPPIEELTPDPKDSHEPRLLQLDRLLEDWDQDAAARHEAHTTGQPRGPITGLGKVDHELGGAFTPGLHIVHAQPGAGKTAFALQVAASCGCPCLFVTCEMGPLELLRRITARVTGTFLGKLKTGELTPDVSHELVKRAVKHAPDLWLADASQSYASCTWIRDSAEPVRAGRPHLLIVVDSVHSWADGGDCRKVGTEYDAISEAIGALRILASRLDCPILAVAERNRASMKGGGLSAGAGTRKIEYGAEVVLDLERNLDAAPDASGEVPVKLVFAKNRSGAAGRKVELLFNGALMRFREL